MYQRWRAKNFQSHEDSQIDFCPFVNVILGLSTVGKTAVLRSLRLLTDNRPSGARYFSNFAGKKGETEISLDLTDGSVKIVKSIALKKDGSREVKATRYHMVKDGKKFEFTGVGESVPDQISELLNLSELNAQRQFDPPFLVNASGGVIARTINRITNLEKVDEWVSTLTSKINDSNRAIVALEKEVELARNDLERYADVDQTGDIINSAIATHNQIGLLVVRIAKLDQDLIDYEDKCRSLERLKEFAKSEKYLIRASGFQKDIDLHDNLQGLMDDYSRLSFEAGKQKSQIKALSDILRRIEDIIVDDKSFNILTGLYHSWISLISRQEYLERIFGEFYEIHSKIKPIDETDYLSLKGQMGSMKLSADNQKNLAELYENTKTGYLATLRKVKLCPTCQTPMTEKQIKTLEKSL